MFESDEKPAEVINEIADRLRRLEEKEKLVLEKEKALNAEAAEAEKEEHEEIVQYYHGNYDDISRSPKMHRMFNAAIATVQEDDPSLSPQEAIDMAASDTYKFYGIDTAEPEKKTPVKTPRRAGAPRKLQDDTPKPQTTEEILADMQRSRGRSPTL